MFFEDLSLRDIHRHRSFHREGEALCENAAREKNQRLLDSAPQALKEPLRDQRALEILSKRGTAELRIDFGKGCTFKASEEIEPCRQELNRLWHGTIVAEVHETRLYSVRWKLSYAPH